MVKLSFKLYGKSVYVNAEKGLLRWGSKGSSHSPAKFFQLCTKAEARALRKYLVKQGMEHIARVHSLPRPY